jgi:Uma2 family endonuclease
MSSTISRPRTKVAKKLPVLEVGDHLDQPTFHARYQAMQTDHKYELIRGTVYMASPPKSWHGRHMRLLARWMDEYIEATEGTDSVVNSSDILSDEDEPQPDGCIFVLPEHGGQTQEVNGWLTGAPELVAEVASSSESYDLHQKKGLYEQKGVKEYIVIALRQKKLFWFVVRAGKYAELKPGADCILRSETFPGLWLDPAALIQLNRKKLLKVLRQGLASPEHEAFVAKLAARKST